jgi:hypothetical protein
MAPEREGTMSPRERVMPKVLFATLREERCRFA